MHPPENEVRFEQVCVEAEAVPAQSALPSIPGWYLDGLQAKTAGLCIAISLPSNVRTCWPAAGG